MAELRRVEREENGQFTQIAFADLKKGDRFKLYDRSPNPIEDGRQVYLALSDPESWASNSTAPQDLYVESVKADSPYLKGVAVA